MKGLILHLAAVSKDQNQLKAKDSFCEGMQLRTK
jgi:hypothetical protein